MVLTWHPEIFGESPKVSVYSKHFTLYSMLSATCDSYVSGNFLQINIRMLLLLSTQTRTWERGMNGWMWKCEKYYLNVCHVDYEKKRGGGGQIKGEKQMQLPSHTLSDTHTFHAKEWKHILLWLKVNCNLRKRKCHFSNLYFEIKIKMIHVQSDSSFFFLRKSSNSQITVLQLNDFSKCWPGNSEADYSNFAVAAYLHAEEQGFIQTQSEQITTNNKDFGLLFCLVPA